MAGGGGGQGRLDWGGEAGASAEPIPWLKAVDPSAWPVQPSWQPALNEFWPAPSGVSLRRYLQSRLDAGAVIYPPAPMRALALTGLDQVRVVILGQDPYHGPGQAEGLAFSVAPGVKPPPSLRNIFVELQRDLGQALPSDGSLVRWAQQGVLLLNTCLTVEDGQPASHAGQGWETLTDDLIRQCSEQGPPKAFLLWGAHAQQKATLIDGDQHLVLLANHPSPLSARRPPRPFLGCGHFSAVNAWMTDRGQANIRW